MNKKYTIPVGILIIAIALVVIFGAGQEKDSSELTVGAILSLTGDFAFVGQEMQRGIEIALEDYGNSNITVVYEDGGSLDSKTALNALHKLLEIDDAEIILTPEVNTTKALSATLNQQEVPGVVLWDSNDEILTLGEYVFGLGFQNELTGEQMAEFAYNELGARSASVISEFNEWSEIISGAFEAEFERLGGALHLHERVTLDETDVRSMIAKINSAGSDAIYFPLSFQQPIQGTVTQAHDLGYDGYLLSAESFTDVHIANLGELAEGVYVTQPWLQDKTFLEKYIAKYGIDTNPINLSLAGLGYDSIKLIAELTQSMQEQNIPVTSESLRDGLAGFSFEGITGPVSFEKSRIAEKGEVVVEVSRGTFVPVKQ